MVEVIGSKIKPNQATHCGVVLLSLVVLTDFVFEIRNGTFQLWGEIETLNY